MRDNPQVLLSSGGDQSETVRKRNQRKRRSEIATKAEKKEEPLSLDHGPAGGREQ